MPTNNVYYSKPKYGVLQPKQKKKSLQFFFGWTTPNFGRKVSLRTIHARNATKMHMFCKHRVAANREPNKKQQQSLAQGIVLYL